uniref:Uncharacterized protein n=1 Tax=Brassica oleracea TaxID=3712 RepID=A0A3P6B8H4_BRAOL|nr:unnamed protein product [Brassica oleracea]
MRRLISPSNTSRLLVMCWMDSPTCCKFGQWKRYRRLGSFVEKNWTREIMM